MCYLLGARTLIATSVSKSYPLHCVKSLRIRLIKYLSSFSPNAGKYGPQKHRIWNFFTQWYKHRLPAITQSEAKRKTHFFDLACTVTLLV